jgi:hypothetical protein
MSIVSITVNPDGTWTRNVNDFDYPWLRDQVGGWIEAVAGGDAELNAMWVAYVNEEGKLHGLPPNPIAEKWMRSHGVGLRFDDYIVGPVVFVGPPDEEGDDTTLRGAVEADLLTYLRRYQ